MRPLRVPATIKRETTKAYLIDVEGREVWLPRSQVAYDTFTQEATIPDWLAARAGLSVAKKQLT